MSQVQNTRTFSRIAVKLCPILTLLCSLTVIITTTYVSEKLSPVFLFFLLQVYLNWYSVYSISSKAVTVKVGDLRNNALMMYSRTINVPQNSSEAHKFWHCEKCQSYMCRPTQHCVFCKKCFHFRDHHCFFLGACILRQNVGNFILLCFYTSLTCLYSLCVLGPHLYENINHIIKPDTNFLNIFLNFCFPVALVKLLFSRENTCILLVTMFDTLVSIFCICLVYGIWKLHSCLMGKQRYANVTGKQNLREIFGSYGLSNIIFPYNGLIGTRDISGKYQLKEV